ncbi:hypothetical protein CCYA_CCYA13G3474 [Cyanidiococcus yangmingshanensis]|nr:hypothetical protein CCYA_CCYA13G3474 [Cyanidiococcus yangmingshanensis]
MNACLWSVFRRVGHSGPVERLAGLLSHRERVWTSARLLGERTRPERRFWQRRCSSKALGEESGHLWGKYESLWRQRSPAARSGLDAWRRLQSTSPKWAASIVHSACRSHSHRLFSSSGRADVGGLPPPLPHPSAASTLRMHKQRKLKPRPGVSGEPPRLCAAYCLASGYRLEDLRDLLRSLPMVTQLIASTFSRDVIHCRVRSANRPAQSTGSSPDGHAFFFESGATVFWDVDEDTQRELLRLARRCDVQPGYVSNVAYEDFDHEFEFAYLMDSAQVTEWERSKRSNPSETGSSTSIGEKKTTCVADDAARTHEQSVASDSTETSSFRAAMVSAARSMDRASNSPAQFRNDRIFLHDYADALSMLAISFGLAQSVKLLVFEVGIDRLVEETRRLPEELAKYGRFRTVAQDDLRRRIGQLLTAKYSVALLSDILDTPDIFWEYPSGETVYNQSVQVVDLQKRARLLDKRMDIVQDSLALLNSELATSTTHRVERAIVALIAIELGLQVFNKLF